MASFKNMNKKKITELLIFIVSAELVGALSALIAGNSSHFYNELAQPPLSPPSWLFPIVWAILYALMGISVYMIYRADLSEDSKRKAYIIYGVQLFVNFLWSIAFFRIKMIGISVGIIVLLDALIITMLVIFHKLKPASAYLNIPYLVWTLFATYLNISILLLN